MYSLELYLSYLFFLSDNKFKNTKIAMEMTTMFKTKALSIDTINFITI